MVETTPQGVPDNSLSSFLDGKRAAPTALTRLVHDLDLLTRCKGGLSFDRSLARAKTLDPSNLRL
jgi:hypothetical protein